MQAQHKASVLAKTSEPRIALHKRILVYEWHTIRVSSPSTTVVCLDTTTNVLAGSSWLSGLFGQA